MTDEPFKSVGGYLDSARDISAPSRAFENFHASIVSWHLLEVRKLPADNPVRIIWDRVDLDALPPSEAFDLLRHMPELPKQQGRPKGTGKFAANLDRIFDEMLRLAEAEPGKPDGEIIIEACLSLGIPVHGDPKDTIDHIRKLAMSLPSGNK